MTRIIAGSARGRRLVVSSGRSTRPTADRAREGLFSTLEALTGTLSGARLLDLYAGSGAVGLEALSRGATASLLVESDPGAARAIRTNIEAVGLPGAQLVTTRVERLVAGPVVGAAYDIGFLDPPYDLGDDAVRDVLGDALVHGWLVRHAVVAVERATRDRPWTWPAGFAAGRSRTYGEATLWYGHAGPSPAPSPTEE